MEVVRAWQAGAGGGGQGRIEGLVDGEKVKACRDSAVSFLMPRTSGHGRLICNKT
jgi:hypothetical protein